MSYPDNKSRSQALLERARKVLPGGNSRTTVYHGPYPIYAKSGAGATITDVDGVVRLDFLNNYTSLIHGHAHPATVAAVQGQIGHGFSFAHPTELEIALAEVITARVASVEQVRFANSGTEAVMTAIKAARAFTGRGRIAKCEGLYHGSYDPVEVSLDPGPDAWGDGDPTPQAYWKGMDGGTMDGVVVLPFNDAAAVERILAPHASDLAAVIVDLMPNRAGLMPASEDFVRALRDFTRAHGIVLIFDEVITLRTESGGLQAKYGIAPDFTTMGKIIGGGFPIGAVGGSAEMMSVFDPTAGKPRLPHGGTFNANPISMAAGLAAMQAWDGPAVTRLNALGEKAREIAREAFRKAEVPGQVTGSGSLLMLHPHQRELTGYRDAWRGPREKAMMGHLHHALIDEGVLISPTGLTALSTPMGEAEVERYGEALTRALQRVRDAGLVP